MAHLNYHGRIVARFKAPDSHKRLHLTDTGRVLVTTGPRMGSAKMLRDKDGHMEDMDPHTFNLHCEHKGYIQEAI